MKELLHLRIKSLRDNYNIHLRFVLYLCVSFFLLSVFDSIISYITPVIMTDSGLTDVQMGILYASSSLFGLILDFIFAKFLKTTHYNRTLLYTTLIGLLMPFLMFFHQSYILFFLAMFVWGLYYNLWGFASSDFTAREAKIAFHVASASILMFFHDIGYIVGTLGAEPLLSNFEYNQIAYILLPILLLSIFFQIPGLIKGKKLHTTHNIIITKPSMKDELDRIRSVVKLLFPLLILGVARSTMDAITWTVTPLIDKIAPELDSLGGIILAVNFLPSFLAYSLASSLTLRFGKKKTGIFSFMFGSAILTLLGIANGPTEYLTISFCSSFFLSISYASTAGAYADYLRESKSYDGEIMTTSDMAINFGYIIGPVVGGILLSTINSTLLFTYVGLAGIITALFVIFITPRHIPFYDKYLNTVNK